MYNIGICSTALHPTYCTVLYKFGTSPRVHFIFHAHGVWTYFILYLINRTVLFTYCINTVVQCGTGGANNAGANHYGSYTIYTKGIVVIRLLKSLKPLNRMSSAIYAQCTVRQH